MSESFMFPPVNYTTKHFGATESLQLRNLSPRAGLELMLTQWLWLMTLRPVVENKLLEIDRND